MLTLSLPFFCLVFIFDVLYWSFPLKNRGQIHFHALLFNLINGLELHETLNPCLLATTETELKAAEAMAAQELLNEMVQKWGGALQANHPATLPRDRPNGEETNYSAQRKAAMKSTNKLYREKFSLDYPDTLGPGGHHGNIDQWAQPQGFQEPVNDGLKRNHWDYYYAHGQTPHKYMSPQQAQKKFKNDGSIRLERSLNVATSADVKRRTSFQVEHAANASADDLDYMFNLESGSKAFKSLRPIDLDGSFEKGRQSLLFKSPLFHATVNGTGSPAVKRSRMTPMNVRASLVQNFNFASSPNHWSSRSGTLSNTTTSKNIEKLKKSTAQNSPDRVKALKETKTSPSSSPPAYYDSRSPLRVEQINYPSSSDASSTSGSNDGSFSAFDHSMIDQTFDLPISGSEKNRMKLVSHFQQLCDLVNRVQLHSCSNYCLELKKKKKKWVCRFQYGSISIKDRAQNRQSYIDSSGKPCHKNPMLQTTGTKTKFAGPRDHPYLNMHLTTMLLGYGANVDSQFILAPTCDLSQLGGQNRYHSKVSSANEEEKEDEDSENEMQTAARNVVDWIQEQEDKRAAEMDDAQQVAARLYNAQVYCSRDYMNLNQLSIIIQRYICGYACVSTNHPTPRC